MLVKVGPKVLSRNLSRGLKCISARNISKNLESLCLCRNVSHCCCYSISLMMFFAEMCTICSLCDPKMKSCGMLTRSKRALPCMQFISSCITHITWHPITTPLPHTLFFYLLLRAFSVVLNVILFVFQSCMLIWWLSFHFFSWCLVCWLHHGWNGPG